jgi:hypothetical protein
VMIRFVDLGRQLSLSLDEQHFAFFDTITDEFRTFSGNCVWSSWEEFEADYTGDELDRYRRLAQASWKKTTSTT